MDDIKSFTAPIGKTVWTTDDKDVLVETVVTQRTIDVKKLLSDKAKLVEQLNNQPSVDELVAMELERQQFERERLLSMIDAIDKEINPDG
jgi:hypothetical protein